MTLTRRTFGKGALALIAAIASKSAIAQSQEEENMLSIKPFKIQISDEAVVDLKDRLGKARWPHAITDDWSRGQPTKLIKELSDQWMNKYDWRAHAAPLTQN